ncbi:dispersed gene family protein 1 (DGF-1), putative, partial [Trypanosoma cruzi marinkellei]
ACSSCRCCVWWAWLRLCIARGKLPRPVLQHGGCAACGRGRGCLHEHDALGLPDGDARCELLLLAALCVISAVNHLAPSDGGARAYVALLLLLTAVLLAVTVYCAVVWYVEDRHWQELREPQRGDLEALLRDDEEGDEELWKQHDRNSSSYRPPAPPQWERIIGSNERNPDNIGRQPQPLTVDAHSNALTFLDRASTTRGSVAYALL